MANSFTPIFKRKIVVNKSKYDNVTLIDNDEARCNDYKCPIRGFCARAVQLRIDSLNNMESAPIKDFKGREKRGLCDNFLNAEFLLEEINKLKGEKNEHI